MIACPDTLNTRRCSSVWAQAIATEKINAATAGSLINRDFSFLGTLMSSEKLHCEWSEAIQFSFQ